MSEEQKLGAVRVLSLALTRMGSPSPDLRNDLAEGLDKFYPNRNDLLNREISPLLIYLASSDVVEKTWRFWKKLPRSNSKSGKSSISAPLKPAGPSNNGSVISNGSIRITIISLILRNF